MGLGKRLLLLTAALGLAGCGGGKRPLVEDLAGRADLRMFKLANIEGTRDGDRLSANALITDSSSMLTLECRFRVGVPTRLEAGIWRWVRGGREERGSILAHSVTFLGGQDGPPALGGTFDLLGMDDQPRYRINLPVTPLRHNAPPQT